jgi:hypothetical protein
MVVGVDWMKQKTFIVIIIVCILVPFLLFGSYSIGYTQGTNNFNKQASESSYLAGLHEGRASGYEVGYADGLAAQNNTVP